MTALDRTKDAKSFCQPSSILWSLNLTLRKEVVCKFSGTWTVLVNWGYVAKYSERQSSSQNWTVGVFFSMDSVWPLSLLHLGCWLSSSVGVLCLGLTKGLTGQHLGCPRCQSSAAGPLRSLAGSVPHLLIVPWFFFPGPWGCSEVDSFSLHQQTSAHTGSEVLGP